MTELIVVEKLAEWKRLKALVLDSVSSPITIELLQKLRAERLLLLFCLLENGPGN